MSSKIEMIKIDKLHPHPDNPRKDLGELEELAESIKSQGILQNLTIVPWFSSITRVGCDFPEQQEKMGYRIVIGHRRHAAAKLAGLTELPCIIAEMTPQEQVATMLLENMQRSDLTIYEQAQGFQMMINFGETMENIAEKTGFSETTVRRRVKLLELDQEKLKEGVNRGATLMDFEEIAKIKDPEKRNQVLDAVGTDDFEWDLKDAIRDQEKEEMKIRIIEKLEKFAKNADTLDEDIDTSFQIRLNYDKKSLEQIPVPEAGKEYAYKDHGWSIYLMEIKNNGEETEAQKKERELEEKKELREKERKAWIDEIKKITTELRKDFIDSLTNAKLKPYLSDLLLLAIESRTSFYLWEGELKKIFEIETEKFDFQEIEKKVNDDPEISLLKIIIGNGSLKTNTYIDWRGEHSESKSLDMLYDLLIKLGYKMSEEEKQLQDGTHEVFIPIED